METGYAAVEAKNAEFAEKFVNIIKNNETAFRNASEIQDYIKVSFFITRIYLCVT